MVAADDRAAARELLAKLSDNRLAELLEGGLGQRESKARLLLQLERAVDNRRRILEKLCLQRIALGISERFHDQAGRSRCNDVGVNEAVVCGAT